MRASDRFRTVLSDYRIHGFRYASLRNVGNDTTYLRIYQFLLPSQQVRGMLVGLDGKAPDEAVRRTNRVMRESAQPQMATCPAPHTSPPPTARQLLPHPPQLASVDAVSHPLSVPVAGIEQFS